MAYHKEESFCFLKRKYWEESVGKTLEFSFDGIGGAAQAMSPAALPSGHNHKGFFWRALINLLLIGFLFGFVALYSFLLGSSNGLIGLTIAMAMISFYRTDIGIKPLQGACVIWGVFLLTGVATFLASFHPAIGVFVNLASVYIILMLTSHQPMAKAYYPILSCYLFAQSSHVYGAEYGLRMIGIAGGGLLVAIVYYLRHRKVERRRSIADIFRETHVCSLRTKFFIRLTAGLTIAMLIGDFYHVLKPAWISFTVLSLMQPFMGESKKKIWCRIIGTLIGGALFFVLFEWIVPAAWHPVLLLLTGYIYLFLHTYWIQQVFVTLNSLSGAMVFLQADVAFEMRILFVLIGVAIVVAIGLCARLRLVDRIYALVLKWKARIQKKTPID